MARISAVMVCRSVYQVLLAPTYFAQRPLHQHARRRSCRPVLLQRRQRVRLSLRRMRPSTHRPTHRLRRPAHQLLNRLFCRHKNRPASPPPTQHSLPVRQLHPLLSQRRSQPVSLPRQPTHQLHQPTRQQASRRQSHPPLSRQSNRQSVRHRAPFAQRQASVARLQSVVISWTITMPWLASAVSPPERHVSPWVTRAVTPLSSVSTRLDLLSAKSPLSHRPRHRQKSPPRHRQAPPPSQPMRQSIRPPTRPPRQQRSQPQSPPKSQRPSQPLNPLRHRRCPRQSPPLPVFYLVENVRCKASVVCRLARLTVLTTAAVSLHRVSAKPRAILAARLAKSATLKTICRPTFASFL